MELFYWLMIVFLLSYEPVYGYFDYQTFKRRVQTDQAVRISYYKKVMAGLWLPTLAILAAAVFGPLTAGDIGLKWIEINTAPLGKGMTYAVIGMALLYILVLMYYWAGYKYSEKIRTDIQKAKKKTLATTSFSDIMPVTKEDKKAWTLVSWTAGITEELIYRGFLVFALGQLFPGWPLWLVLIAGSVLFGLAHTYQGYGNVIKTSLIGLFFALLYISLGSVIPLILLHFLIDYVGKIGDDEETGIAARDMPAS
ncbi:hypothetical protein A8F94_17930 [Bacillus sp. FJAT-27225]|uniref:CPBP family intramembrane glutamic endopeptidase n=1 Tax=Bacillus sp. FJAT-27225 TaxID=1743144 RepID=UPI00080C3277|nr:CPBP family intramembrane glutamic endopeptidase [Bacillus sp. FJAT-27225]OCA83025.1 hypothetical protein A8F94_17930 [Bacillus sp. FJAT-27225]